MRYIGVYSAITCIYLFFIGSSLSVAFAQTSTPSEPLTKILALVKTDPDKAVERARVIYQQKSRADEDSILLMNIMAEGLMRLGELDEAMEYADKSIRLQDIIENTTYQLDTYRIIAEIQSQQGAFERVIETSLKGLELAESTANFDYLRDFFHEMGIAYFRLGNLENSEKYFVRGYEVALEHNLPSHRASSLVALAIINREKQQPDEALALYAEALALYEELGNESGVASVYNNIGVIYEDKQDYQRMLTNLQNALAIYERINARDNITIGLLNVGNAYRLLENYEKARDFLERAEARAIENNSKIILRNIYEELTNLFIDLDNYQTAYTFHLKQDEIDNQIQNSEAKKVAQEIGEKYESEIKERRIELLEQEKQKDRYVIVLVSALSLFTLITMMLMISRFRQKQRFLNEITEKNQKLEVLSTTDPLTELPNRRVVYEAINSEIARCNRYAQPFSIIIFDIDHFKQVNDKYGHNGGDLILKRIASLITQNIRENDLFGRWGGEEFLLVLASTNQENSLIVAEKLRALIEAMAVEYEGYIIKVTSTLGVCEYQLGTNIEEMIKRADMCLYEGKEAGRNRVVAAPTSQRNQQNENIS
ncbi:diguanylate cyclase [Aestuariibacter sp. AA17]|uniref:diguanylate cyclase n=1 Tax=Fluctibacter corallii TaxID=2984329 RepID=A0ABT3ACE1_9ALTE|nr:diguanylate cyclase [Aestuariibacter sp. AA17]MCV2886330.1 diguanylate cyclase [Aestuariibacter sp. AA17]